MPAPTSSTRRALLGFMGAGILAASTGCEFDLTGDDRTSDSPTAGSDPDVRLLEASRDAVTVAAALVAATVTAHPELSRTLAGLRAAHEAHLDVLGDPESGSDPTPAPTPDPLVADDPAVALNRVTTGEQALLDDLTQAARQAENGQFARLLASMSAGLNQQLPLLEASA